ncbi:MAG: hypothetical protein J6Z25_03495 [Opitutales bacterium]|nr:hypothetical protein [Opitutales bacterium]
MATQKHPDQMLQELAELDRRLRELQRFFQKSKTTVAEDSVFTPSNIEEMIRLLEKINPSEKAMIQTLQLLLPMAKQGKAAFDPPVQSKLVGLHRESSHYNACTSKIKTRTLPRQMI